MGWGGLKFPLPIPCTLGTPPFLSSSHLLVLYVLQFNVAKTFLHVFLPILITLVILLFAHAYLPFR